VAGVAVDGWTDHGHLGAANGRRGPMRQITDFGRQATFITSETFLVLGWALYLRRSGKRGG
jgi:hypothetical protein